MTVDVACTVGEFCALRFAVLVIAPVVEGAVTVTVTEAEAPAATVPRFQVTVPPASTPLSLDET